MNNIKTTITLKFMMAIGFIISLLACDPKKIIFNEQRTFDASKPIVGYFKSKEALQLSLNKNLLSFVGEPGSIVSKKSKFSQLVVGIWKADAVAIKEALDQSPERLYLSAELISTIDVLEDGSLSGQVEIMGEYPIILSVMKKNQKISNKVYLIKDVNQGVSGIIVDAFSLLEAFHESVFVKSIQDAQDTTSPVVGSFLDASNVSATGFTLHWSAASDDKSSQDQLQYMVCSGASLNAIKTIEQCESSVLVMPYTAHTLTLTITDKTPNTTYYYNVVVKDESGNKSIYEGKAQKTNIDVTPPQPGTWKASTLISSTSFTLNWSSATDDAYGASNLEYFVCSGPNIAAIDTVSECEAATQEMAYTANTLKLAISGKAPSATYYYNVIVKDPSGNKAIYAGKSQTTTATDPVLFDSGHHFACRITPDAALYCWGANSDGQLGDGSTDLRASPVQVGTDSDWFSVAAGSVHACAIKFDGRLFCWGQNDYGQLGDGSTTRRLTPTQVGVDTDWQKVAAGAFHTCAIKNDGRLFCWGANSSGEIGDGTTTERHSPVAITPGNDWDIVAAGSYHTCAVKTNGDLYCWGSNSWGQLGDGTTADKTSPINVSLAGVWQNIGAGTDFTCAIRVDHTLYCWGTNVFGQLGDGTNLTRKTPVQVGGDSDWQEVKLGYGHTCAVKMTGSLYCWGRNNRAQLGLGHFSDQLTPQQVGNATDWLAVGLGYEHSCAMKNNPSRDIYCWGYSGFGAVGNGQAYANQFSPVAIGANAEWALKAAAGGMGHFCLIKSDGRLFCAGQNSNGQLGDGTTNSSYNLVQVGSDSDWLSIAAAEKHTCGIKGNGVSNTLHCWGDNSFGKVGDGTSIQRESPVQITGDTDWKSVAAGWDHSCAIKFNGKLYCWGMNSFGQIDGTSMPYNAPHQINADTDWDIVTAGFGVTCGKKTNGTLYCWGMNFFGQLGDGTNLSKSTPTQEFRGDSDWQSLANGLTHTCAIKTNGTLFCWGANPNGELGDGTTVAKNVPTQVGTDTDWQVLAVGWNQSCAIKTNGSLYCWGLNYMGQLGLGHSANQIIPTQVGSDVDWKQIGRGFNGYCAVKANNSAYCWGTNRDGQLTLPVWVTAPLKLP